MPRSRWDPGALLALLGVAAGLALTVLGSLTAVPPPTAQGQGTLRLQGRNLAASPGGLITFSLAVSNSTAATRSLAISVAGGSWPLSVAPSVTVASQTIAPVPVTVHVPFDVGPNGQDSAMLTLTPLGGGNPLSVRLGSSTAGYAEIEGYRGCRFDFDSDGKIGVGDAGILADRFGVQATGSPFDAMVDLNHDGRIGVADIQATAGRTGSACASLPDTDTASLRDAIITPSLKAHLEAFQAIADANGGNRARLQPGYDASVAYVRSQLETAGYAVSIQTFMIPVREELEPTRLERLAPEPKAYSRTLEFSLFGGSPNGNVTATLQAVDVMIPPGPVMNSSTSGCEAADFAGFQAGRIALIQRGTCTFAQKVQNAQTAGAVGVLFFNEGQPASEGQPSREGVIASTVGQGTRVPVFGTSYALGAELVAMIDQHPEGVTMHMLARYGTVERPTYNVLADTPIGDDARTIVVGGHLDSVPQGPGINDNGSGTAAILETAIQMAKLGIEPRNTVRFAFWGGEEGGLLGSNYYVNQLGQAERDAIWMNLNFDMIGSPNFARFLYDGDGSATPRAGPVGSDEIEAIFERFFHLADLPSEPTAFDGRSDYGPFIAVGIPAGGLFTGAEGNKTAEQAERYGGTAGADLDPCYHQACDTITNIHWGVMDEMSDAVADIVLAYAMDDRTVLDRPTGDSLSGPVERLYDLEYMGHEPRY